MEFGIASVAAITVICYLAAQVVKATALDNKADNAVARTERLGRRPGVQPHDKWDSQQRGADAGEHDEPLFRPRPGRYLH